MEETERRIAIAVRDREGEGEGETARDPVLCCRRSACGPVRRPAEAAMNCVRACVQQHSSEQEQLIDS